MIGAQRIISALSEAANSSGLVESFFSSLKLGRVSRRRYRTRSEARADLFDYI